MVFRSEWIYAEPMGKHHRALVLHGPQFRWIKFLPLQIIPKRIRHGLLRSCVRVNYDPPPHLIFKIAETQTELAAAYRLLNSQSNPLEAPSEAPPHIFHALPTTTVILAIWSGTVVATVTLTLENALGLPNIGQFDLLDLKQGPTKMAELTHLAIHPGFYDQQAEILLPLFKYTYQYSRYLCGVEAFFIAGGEPWIDLCEALFLFERQPRRKGYEKFMIPGLAGALLVFKTGIDDLARKYAKKPSERNLFKYFKRRGFNNFHLPNCFNLNTKVVVIAPELMKYFFVEKKDTHLHFRTRPSRYEVNSRSSFIANGINPNDEPVRLAVKDVSLDGFRGYCQGELGIGNCVNLKVAISDFDLADLEAQPVWSDSKGTYGFKILRASKNWSLFLNYLTTARNGAEQVTQVA